MVFLIKADQVRFSGLPLYFLSPENIFIGYAFTTKELAFPKILD